MCRLSEGTLLHSTLLVTRLLFFVEVRIESSVSVLPSTSLLPLLLIPLPLLLLGRDLLIGRQHRLMLKKDLFIKEGLKTLMVEVCFQSLLGFLPFPQLSPSHSCKDYSPGKWKGSGAGSP